MKATSLLEMSARVEEAHEAGFEALVPSGSATTSADVSSKKALKKRPKSRAA